MNSPLPHFSSLTDPRVERTKAHSLEDILFIAIACVICGGESWNDMETFGKAKEDWLILLYYNRFFQTSVNHQYSVLPIFQ